MVILSAVAVMMHLLVVIEGSRFLLHPRRRTGDSNVVKTMVALSAMYLLGGVVLWVQSGPAASSVATAYAAATAAFFLGLINCYANYGARRRTIEPGAMHRGRPYPSQ